MGRAGQAREGARRWWALGLSLVLGLMLGLMAACGAGGGGLRGELRLGRELTSLCAEAEVEVPVTLRNTGDAPLTRDGPDRLSYHWLRPDGSVAMWDGARTELPLARLEPGAAVNLRARLRTPAEPGPFVLRWALVREGGGWWPLDGSGARVEVEVGGPALAYRAVQVGPVPPVSAGERLRVPVVLENAGCEPWSDAAGDRLSYRWEGAEADPIEPLRTRWPEPVAPGARVAVEMEVLGPRAPGTYCLRPQPVREGVRWLPPAPGEQAAACGLVVEPSPRALGVRRLEVPGQAPAGEPVEVRVEVENRGRVPLGPADGLLLRWRPQGPEAPPPATFATFEGALAPGAGGSVAAEVPVPTRPGSWVLELELSREHMGVGAPPVTGPAFATVEVTPPRLAWELLQVAAPDTLWLASTGRAWVRLRNVGREAWSPDRGDVVAYHLRDPSGRRVPLESPRAALPGEVPPGAEVAVALDLRAPPRPGRYLLEVEPVREHVRWFGPPRRGPPPPALSVRSLASPLAALTLLLALLAVARPGRAVALSALALAAGCLALDQAFFEAADLEPWAGARPASLTVGLALAAGVGALGRRRRRLGLAVTGAALLLLSALVAADVAHAGFFGAPLGPRALFAARQLLHVEASARHLLVRVPPAVALVASAALGPWLAAGRARPSRDGPACARKRRREMGRLWLALGALAALPGAAVLARGAVGTLGRRVFSERDNVSRFGVLGAHAQALVRLVRTGDREPLPPGGEEEVRAEYRARARARVDGPWSGAARGADLLLVQAEALAGWVLDVRVAGEPVMPFLARFQETGLRFDGVFDQTAEGNTSDAEYLVMTSNHPLSAGALAFLRADRHFVTLAKALARAGYTTISAHPFDRAFWNRAVLHPAYGFARSLFREELGPGRVVGWGLADAPFLRRGAKLLEQAPRPAFVWLITLSLHHPYESFPADLAELDLAAEDPRLPGTPLGNYLQAMRALDRALEAMVGELERAGRLERVVLAIYGDHDPRLPFTPPLVRLLGAPAWDPSIPAREERIPLLLRLPGAPAEARGRRDRVGGHVDIAPTLLDLLGVPVPGSFLGRSLLAPPGDEPPMAALRHGGAVDAERIFVPVGEGIAPGGACFARASGELLPREACEDLVARARREQSMSRAALDHDLFRALAGLE